MLLTIKIHTTTIVVGKHAIAVACKLVDQWQQRTGKIVEGRAGFQLSETEINTAQQPDHFAAICQKNLTNMSRSFDQTLKQCVASGYIPPITYRLGDDFWMLEQLIDCETAIRQHFPDFRYNIDVNLWSPVDDYELDLRNELAYTTPSQRDCRHLFDSRPTPLLPQQKNGHSQTRSSQRAV